MIVSKEKPKRFIGVDWGEREAHFEVQYHMGPDGKLRFDSVSIMPGRDPNGVTTLRKARRLPKQRGEYYFGDNVWEYVKTSIGVDLLGILKKLAKENAE